MKATEEKGCLVVACSQGRVSISKDVLNGLSKTQFLAGHKHLGDEAEKVWEALEPHKSKK